MRVILAAGVVASTVAIPQILFNEAAAAAPSHLGAPLRQVVEPGDPSSPSSIPVESTSTTLDEQDRPAEGRPVDAVSRRGIAGSGQSGIYAGIDTTVVEAGSGGGGRGGSGGGGGPVRAIDCLVIELDPTAEGIGSVTPGLRNYEIEQATSLAEGGRYYQECWYVDTGDLFYANVWDQGPPGQPGVNPRVLAQSALSRTPFTVPAPAMAPAMDGEQITGLPTWLWLDPSNWAPVEASAAAAGVSVTVTATPVRVEWDMGDGSVVECDGPGTVWNFGGANPDDTDCSHVYQDTSVDELDGRYSGSATIVWSIAWEASTGESGTLPDGRSSTPFSLLVNEMQAVVTYDG